MSNSYRITSKAGADFGVYAGETAEEAFAAMVAECGDGVDTEGNSTVGTMADWIIEEVDGVYTYRTDATHCDTEYDSEAEAIAAAIADGEWAEFDSDREDRDIDDGAWLCIYEDGAPVTVRGTMP
ncbi:MAG: hypothetical protein WC121_11680 [Candidatus Kapaibacterium sp.]|jgi:hypothetical protein